MSKARVRRELILAPIAMEFFDGGGVWVEDEFDAVTVAVAVTVVVVVAEMVSVLLLGDVEPDVRLYITSPAGMENGEWLPLVLNLQVVLEVSDSPQQNMVPW